MHSSCIAGDVQGIEMMSTAILLASLGEQTSAHPSSADQGTPVSASFASNLSEHVEDPVLSHGERQSVNTFTGLLKTNFEPGSKQLNKIAEVTSESKPSAK